MEKMATLSLEARVARFRAANAGFIRIACYAASIVSLVVAWQALGDSFGVLFVPFTTTMKQLWAMLHGGPLLPALWVSGQLYLTTLAINIVMGVVMGLAIARSKLIASAFEPYIYVLYATPTIALVPFVSVLFGFEFWPRVLVAVLISIFPICWEPRKARAAFRASISTSPPYSVPTNANCGETSSCPMSRPTP